jgi:putative membrane protein
MQDTLSVSPLTKLSPPRLNYWTYSISTLLNQSNTNTISSNQSSQGKSRFSDYEASPMITYNPKDWFKLIFQFHRSDTFRILLPTMTLLGLVTAGLAYLEIHQHIQFKSSTIFHQILGFVLSMLLVFRINTAYERWWEGRKLWGSLVNNCRGLAVKLTAILSGQHSEDLDGLLKLLAQFPDALKEHLRRDGALSSPEPRHCPLYIYQEIVTALENLRANKTLSDEVLLYLNSEVNSLIDITGACERIKNSPIPFSYSLFLKKIIFVYIITMPIPFSIEFGFWGVPAVVLIFYAFASIEIVSEEVEEPFGTDANDLPIDELCIKIEKDIWAIQKRKN